MAETGNPPQTPNVGKELLDVPFPQMIKSMAMGIAQAQFELDLMSLRLMQMMTGQPYDTGQKDPTTSKPIMQDGMKVKFGDKDLSLLELGFTPTFYQFVDTIIEVKMSISMSTESSSSRSTVDASMETKAAVVWTPFGGGAAMSAKVSSVSASYANKFQYSAEGSSLMRTKLVPVPPPAILEERIRRLMGA